MYEYSLFIRLLLSVNLYSATPMFIVWRERGNGCVVTAILSDDVVGGNEAISVEAATVT